MSWEIKLAPEAIDSLSELTEVAANTILDYLEKYLPQVPNPQILADSKSGDIQGICAFLKGTTQGMMRIFAHIDHQKKTIKILHIAPRKESYTKQQKKKLKNLLTSH